MRVSEKLNSNVCAVQVNVMLLNEKEKNDLDSLIALMSSFGIFYQRTLEIEATTREKVPIYSLDP